MTPAEWGAARGAVGQRQTGEKQPAHEHHAPAAVDLGQRVPGEKPLAHERATPARADVGQRQTGEKQPAHEHHAPAPVDLGQRAPGERRPAQEAAAAQAAEEARLDDTLIRRVAGWIVPQRNPAGAVYGLITVGALLAAESGLRDTYPETVGSAAIAVVLYWFAHSYADVLGLRLAEKQHFRREELWATFARDWSIATGAGMPLLALIVAWATGASQSTAVTAAVWTVVVSLIAFELAAGIRSRAKAPEFVLEVLVGTTMGLAILALRALLH